MKEEEKGDNATYEAVKRISEPIFRDFLKETDPNSMAIANYPLKIPIRPNNLRRQATFTLYKNSSIDIYNSTLALLGRDKIYKASHSKLIFVDYNGVRLQIGKKKITAMFSQDKSKNPIEIKAASKEEFYKLKDELKESIKKKLDEALYSFSKNIKMYITKPIWERGEIWFNNKITNRLPENLVVHTKDWKKVYEKGIEELSRKGEEPTNKLMSFISNCMLVDYAPEIKDALIQFAELQNPLRALKQRCNSVQDVIDNKELVNILNQQEKEELSNWVFDNFSISLNRKF